MEQRTVSLTATIALSILTLIVGFFAGMIATNPNDASSVLSTSTRPVNDFVAAPQADSQSGLVTGSDQSETADGSAVAFTLSVDRLSDTQRSMLKTMGITESEIVITHDMVACAEAKIGAVRLDEIRNGASPSFTEGAQLVACYQ